MNRWLALARGVDRGNEVLGAVTAWLVVLMVLAGAWNALARWVGRAAGVMLSSNSLIEFQWYLFSLVFLLGAADTLRRNGHVRVDAVYSRLAPRRKALVNLVGTLLFLIPFCLFAIGASWPSVANSFAIREMSPDPGGLPRWPIKAMVPLAFLLLLLQGLAAALREWAAWSGRLEAGPTGNSEPHREGA